MEQAVKECSRCKRVLPVTSFKKDQRYALGVSSYCKSCNSEASRRSPSHTSARGVEYKPLPPRDSLEAQMSEKMWSWLEARVPTGLLNALSLVWEAEHQQALENEVDRLESVIEQQDFESDPCAECGQAKCICAGKVDVKAAEFVDVASLPSIPGI